MKEYNKKFKIYDIIKKINYYYGGNMGKLVVISGPSGAGKGTVVKELLKIYDDNNDLVHLSVSATTRSPREGEIDKVNYYFISEKDFIDKIDNKEFLEYNKYGTGKYYGTLKSHVFEYLNNGYDVILEIDINGYKQVIDNYKDALGIFITTPNLEILEQRLRDRGTETEEQIQKRLNTAREELENKDIYPYIIINEDGKSFDAAMEIYNIIKNKG